jgi:hypothetical protein
MLIKRKKMRVQVVRNKVIFITQTQNQFTVFRKKEKKEYIYICIYLFYFKREKR